MKTLNRIQKELKAPKGQRNTFGNYNYRNCEDILEAVKPLLGEATLTLTDDIVMIGDRFYVKATATLKCIERDEKDNSIFPKEIESVSAYARESLDKKGMDSAQITGAASSYARKYALNGLFCIDDTKDDDTTNTGDKESGNVQKGTYKPSKPVTKSLTPKEAYDSASEAIIKANSLVQLKGVQSNVDKSKNLDEQQKFELTAYIREKMETFDPTV